jgi:exodeoxyribonuclease III
VKKAPNALAELVSRHDLDVLCLQETKLQEVHLDDPKLVPKSSGGGGKGGKGDSAAGAPAATIRNLLDGCGYDAHFSCSTAKKGYSGTAVFIRRRGNGGSGGKQKTIDKFFFANKGGDDKKDKKEKKAETLPIDPDLLVPESVSFGMGIEKHDAEGRIVVMDFPLFTMCNVYVPNSGQNLDRLDYRTEEWDRDWVDFMQRKSAERKVPVMWVGDLNVAHTNLEVWNDGAKHLPKQAGVTPQERASFQRQLDAGFVDAFRHLHPDAKGHYSYWSQRAGNREPNKGLRLDYFVGDPSFFDVDGEAKVVARDCYMDPDQEGSDHCPVLLELEIRK